MISYQAMTSPSLVVVDFGIIDRSLMGRLPQIALAPHAAPPHTAASPGTYPPSFSPRPAASASPQAWGPQDYLPAKYRANARLTTAAWLSPVRSASRFTASI